MGSKHLYKINARIYRTSSNLGYYFPLSGSRCSSISTYFLEYGTVATFDGNSILTDLTDSSACMHNNGTCSSQTNILIWDIEPTSRHCLYERVEETLATPKEYYIILENYKVAIAFTK
uniref:CUB domain-containing protein n=1 Tax=Heterorhabditis bacteriophora TaxID=37862 RepID=A0A1I7W869_HETBA